MRKYYDMIVGGERKGGFKKIKDFPSKEKCLNPGHNPPMHIVLQPGIYEYTCPACGHIQTVIIPLITS